MITLYGDATTNTHKVTITLAELGLAYETKTVSMAAGDQYEDWFLKIGPNNKFPVLVDDTTGVTVWDSGPILIHLCEQYDHAGLLLPLAGAERYAVLQFSFFQASNIGPNLGWLNKQLSAPDDQKIPEMLQLFYAEAVRLTQSVDRMLADDRRFIAGDYSIADIMHYPWLQAGLDRKFPALLDKPRIPAWLDRIAERPMIQQGMAAFKND